MHLVQFPTFGFCREIGLKSVFFPQKVHFLGQGSSNEWVDVPQCAKFAKMSFYFLCYCEPPMCRMWHMRRHLRKPVLGPKHQSILAIWVWTKALNMSILPMKKTATIYLQYLSFFLHWKRFDTIWRWEAMREREKECVMIQNRWVRLYMTSCCN